MELPDIDPMDERYRWCVYCKADCWPDPEYQEHADDCPTVTGRFPVADPSLPDGCPRVGGCCRCDRKLGDGDHYRRVEVVEATGEPGFAGAGVMEVVCDDCAMASFMAGEKPRSGGTE